MLNRVTIPFIVVLLSLQTPVHAGSRYLNSPPGASYFRKVDSLNELAFDIKRHDIEKAMSLLYEAMTLATRLEYQKGLATNYLYEAGIYQQNGFSKKALLLYYKALQLSSSAKDTFNIARASQQLGNLQAEARHFKEAERLYLKALADYTTLKRSEDIINIKNSIGLVNLNQDKLKEAERLFSDAYKESKQLHYYYGEKKALYNFGLLNFKLNRLKKAKSFFTSALLLDIEHDDKYSIALSSNKLALIAEKEGKHASGISLAKSAYENASVINAVQVAIESIRTLCSIFENEGKLQEVIKWQNTLIKEQEKLNDKQKNYALNFLDILKEQHEKQLEAERDALNAENRNTYFSRILLIAGISSVIFILLSYFWHREYKKVKAYSKELTDKNELIETNNAALNSLNNAISVQNSHLEESNRMKNKLLSIVSHDLRHPLINTKSILEMINSSDLPEEETKGLLLSLENQYSQSLALVDNLLFWIKGQMSGAPLSLTNLSVNAIISTVITETELSRGRKNTIIINDLTPGLFVTGNEEMLKVVFRNLLSNAGKFTQDGWIRVFATQNKNILSVHIQDNGLGMDQKTIEKVRNQLYFTTKGTNQENGSGFGLMISTDLIQKHGGRLSIESEPGKGSTFTVSLPRT